MEIQCDLELRFCLIQHLPALKKRLIVLPSAVPVKVRKIPAVMSS